MYQSDSFYISNYNNLKSFSPIVTSVFKILSDSTYFHYCNDDEKQSHHQNTIAFIRCTDGQGKIYLKDRTIIIDENECVFLNFQDIVKYKSLTNIWGYRWVNFISKNTDNEFELNKTYTIPFSENEDKAFHKLLTMGQIDFQNENYINSLFLNYFYSIMIENQLKEENILLNPKKRMIDEICSYMHQKVYSKVSVDEIAVFFEISPRRLHQIFITELGISPKKYLLKKKMEEGYKLLVQTSIPINKIAYMLCFSSPYHFTNEFKKIFGQPPSDVRKMEQKYSK